MVVEFVSQIFTKWRVCRTRRRDTSQVLFKILTVSDGWSPCKFQAGQYIYIYTSARALANSTVLSSWVGTAALAFSLCTFLKALTSSSFFLHLRRPFPFSCFTHDQKRRTSCVCINRDVPRQRGPSGDVELAQDPIGGSASVFLSLFLKSRWLS